VKKSRGSATCNKKTARVLVRITLGSTFTGFKKERSDIHKVLSKIKINKKEGGDAAKHRFSKQTDSQATLLDS